MKTMQARYPGRCMRTGAAINPGDNILWHGKGKAELASPSITIDHNLELARSIDPELAAADHESAIAAGRYLAQSMRRSVSHVWRSNDGREYYKNKSGRCEDAPCCGCCNA